MSSSGDGDLRTGGLITEVGAGLSLVISSVSFVESSGEQRVNCIEATSPLRSRASGDAEGEGVPGGGVVSGHVQ